MDRLTKMEIRQLQPQALLTQCLTGECSGDCDNCDHELHALNRLAAYEDTGLTPEEIVKMANVLDLLHELLGPNICNEVLRATGEGRLVVLNYAPGQTVYRIKKQECTECRYFQDCPRMKPHRCPRVVVEEPFKITTTRNVYPTREAAEEVLRRQNGT